jgi:hypothetical protein
MTLEARISQVAAREPSSLRARFHVQLVTLGSLSLLPVNSMDYLSLSLCVFIRGKQLPLHADSLPQKKEEKKQRGAKMGN